MRDYEKLIILFETQGVDVTNFIQLKKNELLLLGSKEIEDESFLEIVNKQHKLVNPIVGYTNPFFMGLGSKKYSLNLEETQIYNYKDKAIQSIYDILQNEDIIDTQKQDIVYRGFQQLSNEYKTVLENTAKSDLKLINSHARLTEAKERKINNKWIKKYIKWFWLLGTLLAVFNYYFIGNTVVDKQYTIAYNVVFNTLIIFPFIKITYFYYLKRASEREQKEIKVIKKRYENLIQINDENIERFEKDLYMYYSAPEKKFSISYLKKTNLQFKYTRMILNNHLQKSIHQQTKNLVFKFIFYINLIIPISAVLLVLLFFILK